VSVILITGTSTGIGNLTARALAADGHTVYASMRGIDSRNSAHAQELRDFASADGLKLSVVELDVESQASANAAIKTVIDAEGFVDVVIHNAGHLFVGYVEAFSAEDIAHLLDVNVLSVQRVNRAVLPHMRARREGTLLYVGSTIPFTTPPFLGPYVVSKAAFDALAIVTMYEVNEFGIETAIVMPGAITEGTQHFPNASHADDPDVTAAYAVFDPMVARNEAATASLFTPGVDPNPVVVADEIARILALPRGEKPLRTVVDFSDSDVESVNEIATKIRERFVNRMGFGEVLRLKK
jgi:NAD(P)-dependent dehydrogenase (short-subunit alcohol dehydrogenase family)